MHLLGPSTRNSLIYRASPQYSKPLSLTHLEFVIKQIQTNTRKRKTLEQEHDEEVDPLDKHYENEKTNEQTKETNIVRCILSTPTSNSTRNALVFPHICKMFPHSPLQNQTISEPHSNPYKLAWLNQTFFPIIQRCLVPIEISPYKDNIRCDILPMYSSVDLGFTTSPLLITNKKIPTHSNTRKKIKMYSIKPRKLELNLNLLTKTTHPLRQPHHPLTQCTFDKKKMQALWNFKTYLAQSYLIIPTYMTDHTKDLIPISPLSQLNKPIN